MSADDDNNADSEEGGVVQQPAEQAKQNKPSARHRKDAVVGGKPGGVVVARPTNAGPQEETVRLVGEPLVSHGPYTFYSALGYRDHVAKRKKRRRWKTAPCSGEACGDDSCSCSDDDDDDDGRTSSSSDSQWSVVRMNHFYAVCPWYSKRNSCAGDQVQTGQQPRGRKKSPTARAAAGKEPRQHQHQQSVCIGELELLWRDDSVAMTAKRGGDKSVAANGGGSVVTTTSSSNNSLQAPSSDEEAPAAAPAGGTATDPTAASLPRRRMLPRRTRQPSAKKIEAAESYAAAASDRSHPLHSTYRRNQLSAASAACPARAPQPSPADAHYAHGNLLCSIRLYVMPDQTAAGRLSGVHGEDEVLEINSCSAEFVNGGGGGGGGGMGSVYSAAAGDDYGYGGGGGGGSHSGAPQSGCSGLVLRVEDFIEWVRGGQMNGNENGDAETEDESTDSGGDGKSSAAADTAESEKPKPSVPLADGVRGGRGEDAQTNETQTGPSEIADVAIKEESTALEKDAEHASRAAATAELVEAKKERQESTEDGGARHAKSVVDEALNAERVPLAAADIRKNRDGTRRRQHRLDCSKSSVNGGGGLDGVVAAERVSLTEKQKVDTGRDEQQCGSEKRKTSDRQQLVVMSYSRYCRYRAQLQRSREERLDRGDGSFDSGNSMTDQMNTVRVLFCRDTYDYPAELLLQPFNPPHGYQHNSAVLANHMAPKLKGWPAYPASWMSFRWNRMRRRLRHMERGNGTNDEQQRRLRRKKLKKKGRRRQNGASGTTVALGYLSSTDDRDSDDSDSDDGSSATNDGATNTTTSDSDGAPPNATVIAKTAIKNLASKENGSDHHKNRPVISVSAASNIYFINGTTVSTVNANKRPAVIAGQSVQQQSSKRRCIVYTSATTGQRPQLRAVYQQQQQQQQPRPRQPQQLYQQFNQLSQSQRHHFLVAQQHQQRLQLNRRLPTPVSSLQPLTTRLTHHHLPPSVSILPVIMPGTKNVTIFQQQQRSNDRLQSRPKQLAAVSITQSKNSNSNRPQTSLSPVIVEYDKSQKQRSDSYEKNNTLATAMATCHKRIRCIDLEQEQSEDEERQRRWLVDALRLGGLEVTAVPVKNNSESHNKNGSENNRAVNPVAILPQQPQLKREKQSSNYEQPNGNVSVQYEKRQDCSNDDSNQDSDTDSVVMTVTPDVISFLNKSRQQQQSKSQTSSVSCSTSLSTPAQKQRPTVVKDTASSYGQRAPGMVSAPALHDKINRAIDSLKQQQQKQPMKSSSLFTIDAPSPRLFNKVISYTLGELGQRKVGTVGTNPIRQQLQTLKPVKQIPSAVKIKINPQQKQQTQKRESASLPTPATNLEISLVPTTMAVAYVTKVQSQQQQKSCTSAVVRNISVSSSEASSSMSVKQQLQRRITAGSLKTPALTPIMGALSSGSVQSHTQQQRNNISTFVTTTAPLLQSTQQQIIILTSPASNVSVAKQPLNDKIYPQQKKKD